MRTAIVGGTGSIGMATAARLVRHGIDVTIVSRRPPANAPRGVPWRAADVTDPAALRTVLADAKIERLVHLAALLQFACESDPAQAVRINVDGTLNVIEAARDLGISRVVFGSSIAVYGERFHTMRETDAIPESVGLYGMTKRLGELLGERFRANGALEFAALRYSAVFGPGEATTSGMARVRQRIFECARGEDVAIEGASGEELAHLTYVDDAAEATCRVLLGPPPPRSIYNVAGPRDGHVSLRELHRRVCEIVPHAGRALWSGSARTAGPVDLTRMAEDYGWSPSISLDDGLRRLLLREAQTIDLEEIR